MGDPTFVAYIDESGDEGFRFNAGSSDWFVLSAFICRKSEIADVDRLAADVRVILNKPVHHELHFRKLKHEHRVALTNELAKSPYKSMSILTHKPSLMKPTSFNGDCKLYRYNLRYLLERVSWYCRDNKQFRDAGDGSVELIFSKRMRMSYADIISYLDLLLSNASLRVDGEQIIDVRLSGAIIKTDQITALPARWRSGLQFADVVATSCYYGVELSQVGYVESRYLTTLKPMLYAYKSRVLRYGLKFFPILEKDLGNVNAQLEWVLKEFQ